MKKRNTPYAIAIALTCLLMMSAVHAQNQTERKKNKNITPATTNPVAGSGTAGQITKWTGVSGSSTYVIGDSNIFEDKFGKIGIGTTTPTSLLTVQGMIETTLGGYKFPDGTIQTTAGIPFVIHDASLMGDGRSATPLGIAFGGVQTIHLANGAVTAPKIANSTVVRSLNGLFDNVSLAGGSNITITPSGNTLTIASPNSLTSVSHDSTLTGAGTSGSPLGVANGGIGNAQLANNAVTSSKIASGQVVFEVNGLTDSVTLAAGSNITITPSGNTLTIGETASASAVYIARNAFGVSIDPGRIVLQKDIPAGSYVIFFKAQMNASDSSNFQTGTCALSTGEKTEVRLIDDGSENGRGTSVLNDTATFSTPATISVSCSGSKFKVFNSVLMAVKVGSIQ